MEIKRILPSPEKSFFLFGPRGTGKSTWLAQAFPHALRIDLLRTAVYLELLKEPSKLRSMIEGNNIDWVIIDEIQKLPILLDEVHSMLFDFKGKVKFALTGSSARKLKLGHANLLAGRALTKKMFPFSLGEVGFDSNIDSILKFGFLPEVFLTNNEDLKRDILLSYVDTYLKEEIQQETKVRDLASFSRFLGIASLLNGQVLNMSNVARECGLSRSTVQGHFSILIDTLLGTLLEPYRPKAKVKEVSSPKFYFFDVGVVRALNGNLNSPIEGQEKGFLLETLVLNELRAANEYNSWFGEIYYWRTSDGNEVDFILKRGKELIGIEVKSSTKWKNDYNFGLNTLLENKVIQRAIGIYLGNEKLKIGEIEIYPFFEKDLFQKL